jgi:hypothetical protein
MSSHRRNQYGRRHHPLPPGFCDRQAARRLAVTEAGGNCMSRAPSFRSMRLIAFETVAFESRSSVAAPTKECI